MTLPANKILEKRNPWQNISRLNMGYVDEQYDKYLDNPDTVDPTLRNLFDRWGRPENVERDRTTVQTITEDDSAGTAFDLDQVVGAVRLSERIRAYGHLLAHINPLGENRQVQTHLMDLAAFHLSPKKLKAIPSRFIWPEAPEDVRNALDVVNHLRGLYSQSMAYEFSHVHDLKEKKWLNEMIESKRFHFGLNDQEKKDLLKQLTKVETFEQFLHKTFVGQKRFSIEGLDVLVPMLDKLIQFGVSDGTKQVMIGMAHRGRLSVLAHILGKPYEKILAEFVHAPIKSMVPSEGSKGINYGWTGDVKYHLGAWRAIEEGEKKYLLQYAGEKDRTDGEIQARLTLANNPSHLEVVDPVIEGYARAAQDDRSERGYPTQNLEKAFSIMIHGDAAFTGEGVVAETLNLSRLSGFNTGGTIHIIANNQLGFTTDHEDGRSTAYASDLAKGFEVPIVHVNADDPEACLRAIFLAYHYRRTFHKDFLIDLCGYRRYGHNESDDPQATQPLLYRKIRNHPTVADIYLKKLEENGLVAMQERDAYRKHLLEKLQAIYNASREQQKKELKAIPFPEKLAQSLDHIRTSVPIGELKDLNAQLLDWPEDFHVYPKLARILNRRKNALNAGHRIDWGTGETLAFASILKDGTPIRFTGQDVERGTFAHRHSVLHDAETGATYSPFHHLKGVHASFDIHNSPLSETAVIGFEYGYNVCAPETLVIWEAQFGDFANVGQVMFDQFVAAGRAKWGQKSGMVILLPHGYEGMGPEHSSGRLERFLQLSAENNWTVANLTSPAQYFHILRRQASILHSDLARPLVIMSPKSLLRHPKAASSPADLSEGRFQSVMEEPLTGGKPEKVERIVLCSGKVAIDLAVEIETQTASLDWLHVLRVEELYPFPSEKLKDFFRKYPQLKEIVWLQEEPKNMGAWAYAESRLRKILPHRAALRYIGRIAHSSPATGEPEFHKRGQRRILTEALTKDF
ncbi:2-oxoglutarate dehydrogenase E1 component [Sporolactobacillus sp. THM7-7]|nr:2-oxoglutarate dehydrogenase E1 component [Sporolactobacillus sp. THM7-7]